MLDLNARYKRREKNKINNLKCTKTNSDFSSVFLLFGKIHFFNKTMLHLITLLLNMSIKLSIILIEKSIQKHDQKASPDKRRVNLCKVLHRSKRFFS